MTASRIEYPGSVAIDPVLLEAAGLVPYESVLIADLDNGNRLETYVVSGKRHSGEISILGAAAQLIKEGDLVIILAFAYCTQEEACGVTPKVVVLGPGNKIMDHPDGEY